MQLGRNLKKKYEVINMEFSEIINKIRTAVYGREVRSAIADGMVEINKIAENSNSVAERAMQTAYGATMVNYHEMTQTTNTYQSITPISVSGSKNLSIINGLLRVNDSGKYLYFIRAQAIQKSKIVRYLDSTTEIKLLSNSSTPYSTACMLVDFGIMELKKDDYFILQTKADIDDGGYVAGLNLALIRIGDISTE